MHLNQYDSLGAALRFIRDTERCADAWAASTSNGASADWDYGLGYDGALRVVERGGFWPQGIANLQRAHAIAAPRSCAPSPRVELDVCGWAPDVPAYLSGSPCAMYSDGSDTSPQPVPIVRVMVSAFSSGVTAVQATNRGAALLACADALEAAGTQVELAVGLTARGEYNDEVTIKQAGESVPLAGLAFAVCHPAMLRRVFFALQERRDEGVSWTQRGYGGGTHPTRGYWDVVVPYFVARGVSEYDTPQSALVAMQTIFDKALKSR